MCERGDLLLLYTDGISEARNPSGAEYGMKRLASVAGDAHLFDEYVALDVAGRATFFAIY